MDNIPKIIIGVLLLAIIGFFVVSLGNIFVPIGDKKSLDMVCENYAEQMRKQGGLTTNQVNDIQVRLSSYGLENIALTISRKGTVSLGEDLVFNIRGVYKTREVTGLFQSQETDINYAYNRVYPNDKLIVD